MQDRADLLTSEVDDVNDKLASIGTLSNISLQLYSWYIKNGHARNDNDKAAIEILFNPTLMDAAKDCDGFYEKLYKFQCYCWYAFILQDFLLYYRYCQKWVDLFETEPKMIEIETAHYIKGMHNLMSAHFDLRNYTKFNDTINRFEAFTQTPTVLENQNNKIQTFVYLHLSKINRHFMEGTFEAGIASIPLIEEKLTEYELYLDRHRILVFYYKFASLYFGAGNYSASIDYLNKVINLKGDLRTDLQCYARLLHLIAHYELGNFEILEHLLKSVTRFMAKMDNLGLAESEIFSFLKRSFRLQPSALKPAFEKLLEDLKKVEQDKLASRAFMYLDVISWLESKIEGKEVQDIIRDKYLRSIKE
jgi:tetratricopeptide (TPR) repeat protein